jgi:hypothetical protein
MESVNTRPTTGTTRTGDRGSILKILCRSSDFVILTKSRGRIDLHLSQVYLAPWEYLDIDEGDTRCVRLPLFFSCGTGTHSHNADMQVATWIRRGNC